MTLTTAYALDSSTEGKVKVLKERLLDRSQPLAKRMRVVCSLRAVKGQGTVEALASCLDDQSALLRHEVAYALGQKEDANAVPILIDCLKNDSDSMCSPAPPAARLKPVPRDAAPPAGLPARARAEALGARRVRHECAEALGAIGDAAALRVLEEYERCDCEEVAHTCQLALDRIRWAAKKHGGDSKEANGELATKFQTIDPAPPADPSLSTAQLIEQLMDHSVPLFQRYGALFALRDQASDEAAAGLGRVLLEDKSSAVLRHEVAFVLGQMQRAVALGPLETSLRDTTENQMVRHEAAEAIGAISEESATPMLQEFSKDANQVVAESCIIALDISDYNNDDTQFEYADVDVQ